ncbi:hypothetical protein [Streptacidiphilus jiangxiensis]|uniref:Uncharacterized protein n=1 Tax=Streptacidiphilus jiangxiensis TaxID=235985 RepID=A0A1H7WVV3_STRJI|nr:hypothetical protein [Streptacidiphilus jiangxiensis]SEM25068.1 hypothetical protein SAMN05414137_121155 [Streptacidiphilus jiangxiensis]
MKEKTVGAIIVAVIGAVASIIAATIMAGGGQGSSASASGGGGGNGGSSGGPTVITLPPPSSGIDLPTANSNAVTRPVTVSAAILTMTVTKVTLSGGQTTVDFSIANTSGNPVSFPFAAKELEVPGSPTLQPHDFQGSWSDSVQGGGTVNEELIFDALPAGTRQVTLSLTGIQTFHVCDACPQQLAVDIPLSS